MTYVTSDLHGYDFDSFMTLLDKIGFDNNDFLYVLGDVIDRGDDGIKILKWLMSKPNAQLILGNHEAMLLSCDFLFEEITDKSINGLTSTQLDIYSSWVINGAYPTLKAIQALPKGEIQHILEYLREAPLYDVVTVGGRDFLLTHSGLDNFDESKKLSQYNSHDLLWNRPDINQKYFDEFTLIFGHTPTRYYGEQYEGKALKTDTWIDIDVGCASGFPPMILCLDTMEEYYL